MKKVIIIGASGSLARYVIESLQEQSDVQLTLFLRNKRRLSQPVSKDCTITEGNVMDYDVNKGIQLYRENSCDFILAVGGGSTIDACKAMAAGVHYDGDVMDLMAGGKGEIKEAAPLATVLTMAGTGSELDMGGVITAEEDHKKYSILHPMLYPKFSILDPAYTFSVPEKHSMAGSFDAFDHLLECYFIAGSESTDVQNMMDEGLMRSIVKNAPKILENPEDYAALDKVPEMAGAASALLGSLQYGSGILSTLLLAFFSDSKGDPWTMSWIIALFAIASAGTVLAKGFFQLFPKTMKWDKKYVCLEQELQREKCIRCKHA